MHLSRLCLAALLLAVAACSTGGGSKPTGDMVTAISSLAGKTTSLTLDAGTVGALSLLSVSFKPLGTAKVTGTTINFPITSGYLEVHSEHLVKPAPVQGLIVHDTSGFSLTSGNTVLSLTNLVLDPSGQTLYGTVNGTTIEPLLTISSTTLKPAVTPATVDLSGSEAVLTQTAASLLNMEFKTNAVTAGLKLGMVHLVADASSAVTFPALTHKNYPSLSGTSTSVTLNQTLVDELKSSSVKIFPSGTAKTSSGAISFPITAGFLGVKTPATSGAGSITGAVDHENSGITFTATGGKSVTFSDLLLDPGTMTVSSLISDGKGGGSVVPFLTLDETNAKVSTPDMTVALDGIDATIAPEAAARIAAATGAKIPAATSLGTIHLVASQSTP